MCEKLVKQFLTISMKIRVSFVIIESRAAFYSGLVYLRYKTSRDFPLEVIIPRIRSNLQVCIGTRSGRCAL